MGKTGKVGIRDIQISENSLIYGERNVAYLDKMNKLVSANTATATEFMEYRADEKFRREVDGRKYELLLIYDEVVKEFKERYEELNYDKEQGLISISDWKLKIRDELDEVREAMEAFNEYILGLRNKGYFEMAKDELFRVDEILRELIGL